MPGQFLYLTVQHFLLFKHVSELSWDSFMAEDMPKKKQTNKQNRLIYICIFILSTFFVIKASKLIFLA